MFSFGDKKLLIGLKGFTQSGFLGFNSFRRLKEFRGMTWNSRKQGFTLIELLVVIAIIALLSSVVMASLSTARMKARDSKRIADLNQIKLALEMYYDANGVYPKIYNVAYNVNGYSISSNQTSWNDLSAKLKPYIDPLPKDPINTPTGCGVWATSSPCNVYVYGNVSDGTDSTKAINYDLATQLETPDHPLSCKYNNYKFFFNSAASWCGYTKQIYEASPM